MSLTKIVKAFSGLLLLAVVALPAAADEWSFDFQDTTDGISLTGVIDTSNTLNALGNYNVTGISGEITGLPGEVGTQPIGALLPNPDQPGIFMAPDGNFWDNNLLTAAPYVTFAGIGFNFDGDQLVLFSDVTGDPLSEGLFSQNLQHSFIGTLSIEAVPEPDSSLLLFTGLLALGAFAYLTARRKQHSALIS
jgi:hypothetical protein